MLPAEAAIVRPFARSRRRARMAAGTTDECKAWRQPQSLCVSVWLWTGYSPARLFVQSRFPYEVEEIFRRRLRAWSQGGAGLVALGVGEGTGMRAMPW